MTTTNPIQDLIAARRSYGLADPSPWVVYYPPIGLIADCGTQEEAEAEAESYRKSGNPNNSCGGPVTVHHWPTEM